MVIGILDPVELLEDPVELLAADAAAPVGHGRHRPAVVAPHPHPHLLVGGGVLVGVGDELGQHLDQPQGVGVDLQGPVGQLQLQPAVGAAAPGAAAGFTGTPDLGIACYNPAAGPTVRRPRCPASRPRIPTGAPSSPCNSPPAACPASSPWPSPSPCSAPGWSWPPGTRPPPRPLRARSPSTAPRPTSGSRPTPASGRAGRSPSGSPAGPPTR